MQRSIVIRLAVAASLLATLGGLLIAYGSLTPAPAAGAYPSAETLVTEYDRYVGERVVVGGTVVATGPVRLRTSTPAGPFEVTVQNVERPVERGDSLRVFGIAHEGRTVHATRAIIVERTSLWFTYAVSALAGFWVLTRGVRHWRIDPTKWGLEPRSRPLSYRRLVRKSRESLVESTSTEEGRDA